MDGLVEHNVIHKKISQETVVGILFPGSYQAGMASLAIHYLYGLLNSSEDIVAERLFPRETGSVTLESNLSLKNLDVITCTIQYELNHVGLIRTLLDGGINPYRENRKKEDPLIIVGGPTVTSNPFPLASIADFFFIGDLEPVEQQFIEALSKSSKKEMVNALTKIEGFISGEKITSLSANKDEKITMSNVVHGEWDKSFFPTHQTIADTNSSLKKFHPIFGSAFLIEVNRGCFSRCRFCLLGHMRPQIRNRSFSLLKKLVDTAQEQGIYDKIALYGSAVASHPHFEELVEYIVEKGLKVTIPSLRAESVTPRLIKLIKRGGARTLTLAPETGSDDSRELIHKKLSNQHILSAIKLAKENGMNLFKLYFIYGLPRETEASLLEIVDFIKEIKKIIKGGRLTISITPFIPKPHTSFQYGPFWNLPMIRKKRKKLEKMLREIKGLRYNFFDERWAYIQSFTSLAGTELAPLLVSVAEKGGGLGAWRAAAKKHGFDYSNLLPTQKYPLDKIFPWDRIQMGVNKEKIVKDYSKFLDKIASREETE
ncbi:MAG: radical SAM protein [Candidatus Kariarchaeaceae archaeon]